jgi:hypothetical protein
MDSNPAQNVIKTSALGERPALMANRTGDEI